MADAGDSNPRSPMTYSTDFSGPPADKITRRALEERWVEKPALVQLNSGKMAVAHKIVGNSKATWAVEFLEHSKTTANRAAKIFVKVLNDEGKRGQCLKQTIMSGIGGIFEGGGMRVMTTKLTVDKKGTQSIEYHFLDPDDKPMGGAVKSKVETFLKEYPPTKLKNDDRFVLTYDFGRFPKLIDILEAAGALNPTETSAMERAAAFAWVKGLMGSEEEITTNDQADDTCVELETIALEAPLSPKLGRLKKAASRGVLAIDDIPEKAKVVKALAFKFRIPKRGKEASNESDDGAEEAPPAPKTAKKSASRGKKRGATEADVVGVESEPDSPSGESSDEDEEMQAAQAAAIARKNGKKKATTREPRSTTFADQLDAAGDGEESEDETTTLMSFVKHVDIPFVEGIEIVFNMDAIRKLASVAPLEAATVTIYGSQGLACNAQSVPAKIRRKWSLAFERIITRVGSTWMGKRMPKDKDDLEDRVELLMHLAIQYFEKNGWPSDNQAIFGSNATSPSAGLNAASFQTTHGSTSIQIDPDEDPSGPLAKKALESLSTEKRMGAVGPEVAGNLFKHKGTLDSLPRVSDKNDVRSVVGSCPSSLRPDLQRVVMSNCMVEAPGEIRNTHRTIPAQAQRLKRDADLNIEKAIAAILETDATQEASLDQSHIASLASDASEAKLFMAGGKAAAKSMLKDKAAQDGSARALAEAWSIMAPAITTALENAYLDAAAVKTITNKVTAPEGLMQLQPAQMAEWIDKILNELQREAREFRMGGPREPSLARCIEKFNPNFTYNALKASFKRPSEVSPSQPPKQPKLPKAPVKPKPAKGLTPTGKKEPRPADSGAKTAWPERKATLPSADFAKIKEAAATRYPDTCTWFLVARCSHPSTCTKGTHDRPADFATFIDAQGFKMSGEVRKATSPPMHTSTAAPSQPPRKHCLASQHRLAPRLANAPHISKRKAPKARASRPAPGTLALRSAAQSARAAASTREARRGRRGSAEQPQPHQLKPKQEGKQAIER